MRGKLKRILSLITVLVFSFGMLGSVSANSENMESLQVLADSIIEITSGPDGIVTYSNIEEFVDLARNRFPEISDYKIAYFLHQFTGQNNVDSLSSEIILEILEFKEIGIVDNYLKVNSDGTQIALTEEEATAALETNKDIMPLSMWTSSDGYLRITTTYSLYTTQGNRKYYVISATAYWLKAPACKLKDIICISNTVTYDDSYNDYAYYQQKYQCAGAGDAVHDYETVYDYKYANGTGSGVDLLYPSVNGAGARVNLRAFSCDSSNPGSHNVSMIYMEAYIRYRVIAPINSQFNIQAAYCHTQVGLGSVGFNVSTGGAGISFSFTGVKTEYRARPITILT